MDPLIIEAFKQFGAPLGFLIVIIVFGKKIGSWTVEHIVTPVVQSHISFLNETKNSIKMMAENLQEVKQILAETRKELGQLRERIDDQASSQLSARVDALEKHGG